MSLKPYPCRFAGTMKPFDFVVDAFDHSSGEGMIEEVQDTGTMSDHGTGEFYDVSNPAGLIFFGSS